MVDSTWYKKARKHNQLFNLKLLKTTTNPDTIDEQFSTGVLVEQESLHFSKDVNNFKFQLLILEVNTPIHCMLNIIPGKEDQVSRAKDQSLHEQIF